MQSGQGRFYVIEGIDGCGKDTQVSAVWETLLETYGKHSVRMIRQPSIETDVSFTIRKQLRPIRDEMDKKKKHERLEMQLLYIVDRMWLERKEIVPSLESGEHVLCNRHDPSTITYWSTDTVLYYEKSWGEELTRKNKEIIFKEVYDTYHTIMNAQYKINNLVGGNLQRKKPDLVFLLKTSSAVGINRLHERWEEKIKDGYAKRVGGYRERFEDERFLEQLVEFYDLYFETESKKPQHTQHIIIDAEREPEIIKKELLHRINRDITSSTKT
jgi:thymidylate kinase